MTIPQTTTENLAWGTSTYPCTLWDGFSGKFWGKLSGNFWELIESAAWPIIAIARFSAEYKSLWPLNVHQDVLLA